ncbi:unnamed protein product [Caenorhabditis brenneri]
MMMKSRECMSITTCSRTAKTTASSYWSVWVLAAYPWLAFPLLLCVDLNCYSLCIQKFHLSNSFARNFSSNSVVSQNCNVILTE